MPKATLTFNLPDEREEYQIHMNASKYYCALHDLYLALRSDSKHGEGKWADFYEKFWEILKENEVEDI